MIRRIFSCSLFSITLLLAGCASYKSVSEIPLTPVPAILTSSPFLIPTQIQTLYSSPTGGLPGTLMVATTPAIPISQEGPWLALSSDDGLWVMNPDGTAPTQLSKNYFEFFLRYAIAPNGGRIAFTLLPMHPEDGISFQPELTLVTLPSTSPHQLTHLLSGKPLQEPTLDPEGLDYAGPFANSYAAVMDDKSLAWSPNGSYLAFVGAQDGPSADLYAYSTLDKTITRLTSGPTYAIDPSWSPNGNYIISAGAGQMNYGSGGSLGPNVDSVWAVRPDGTDLRLVHSYSGGHDGPPHILGWVNNESYVEVYAAWGCGNTDLTFVDMLNPLKYKILPGIFTSAALDPETGSLLTLAPYYDLDFCQPSPGPGLYLTSVYGDKPPQKILFDIPTNPDDSTGVLSWSQTAHVFFVNSKASVFAVDLTGQVTPIDIPQMYDSPGYPPFPKVSPDGREWAMFNQTNAGLWIASLDHPAIHVFQGPVDDALWTPDSSFILFVANNTLYRAKAPNYQPIAIAGPFQYSDYLLNWVMP